MRTIRVLLMFIFVASFTYAQEPDKNISLKLILNTEASSLTSDKYHYLTTSPADYTNNSIIKIGSFSFAIEKQKTNGNIRVYELMPLILKRTSHETVLTDTANQAVLIGEIGLHVESDFSYHYFIPQFTSKNNSFVFYLGLGERLNFDHSGFHPKTPESYPHANYLVSLMTAFTPLLRWNLSEKFYGDLQVPVYLADFYFFHDKVDNPALSMEQRSSYGFRFRFFPPVFNFKIALGFRL